MPYYLRVQTEDQVGNQAAWVTLFTLLYDDQPPLISDLSPPNGAVLDTPWPTISATLSECRRFTSPVCKPLSSTKAHCQYMKPSAKGSS